MSEVRHRRKSSSHAAQSKDPTAELLVDQTGSDKWRKAAVRGVFSIVMLSAFSGVIWAGHFYSTAMVLLLSLLSFKEITSIGALASTEKKLPLTRTLNWCFFFAYNYYMFGENLLIVSADLIRADSILHLLAVYHRFVSYVFYISSFVLFVLCLKKGHYKFQFSQFAWTHLTLLIITTQSQAIIANIFNGMIWFLLPVLVVICNDIMAYWFGFFFGRTRLIKLSPKKTWEGFIGALFSTVIFGYFVARFLSEYQYFICPLSDIAFSLHPEVSCTPSDLFVSQDVPIPNAILGVLHAVMPSLSSTVHIKPIMLHGMVFSIFASLIAPFGGFFASGFKRAFKIKDFGDSIPGHGGITDRFDCQFIMGFFAHVYYKSFIGPSVLSVSTVLAMIYQMEPEKQAELLATLQSHVLK